MGRGSVYLSDWVTIRAYKCRWWCCTIHGKIAKQVEYVYLFGRVYFVHYPIDGIVEIWNGNQKRSSPKGKKLRDSPSPKCDHCLKDNESQ
mgnify:CR=1 FL=1